MKTIYILYIGLLLKPSYSRHSKIGNVKLKGFHSYFELLKSVYFKFLNIFNIESA